jgi:hypothetical protein
VVTTGVVEIPASGTITVGATLTAVSIPEQYVLFGGVAISNTVTESYIYGGGTADGDTPGDEYVYSGLPPATASNWRNSSTRWKTISR